jgi:hypothetical protein
MTTKSKPVKIVANPEADITLNTEEAARFAVPETTASCQCGAGNGRKSLAAALAKAQAECQNVTMNKINPHFRSKYADLAAVRDAIIPVFNRHGLSIIQAPTSDLVGGFTLETRVMHSSGSEIIWNFPLPPDTSKMQSIGSAISYARRYTLSAIAGIASEEDDDGNAATNTNGRGYSGGNGAGGQSQGRGGPSSETGGITL